MEKRKSEKRYSIILDWGAANFQVSLHNPICMKTPNISIYCLKCDSSHFGGLRSRAVSPRRDGYFVYGT